MTGGAVKLPASRDAPKTIKRSAPDTPAAQPAPESQVLAPAPELECATHEAAPECTNPECTSPECTSPSAPRPASGVAGRCSSTEADLGRAAA
eukprot:1698247-Prymnesium_polylepis.1